MRATHLSSQIGMASEFDSDTDVNNIKNIVQ